MCWWLALLTIPPAQFKLVLDAIIWALKHTMRHVADTGLSIIYQLLQNVAQADTAAQSFYQTYYIDILQHLFSVVTDSSHTAGTDDIAAFTQLNLFQWLTFTDLATTSTWGYRGDSPTAV